MKFPQSGVQDSAVNNSSFDRLISRVNNGDENAVNELAEVAYERLYRTAQGIVGYGHGTPTMGATALVSEGFARLLNRRSMRKIEDSHHFYSLFATMMKQIIIDYERRKRRLKRGGDLNRVDLETILTSLADPNHTIEELSLAIDELQVRDQRAADIIRMKYFGFLTIEEISRITDLSRSTIQNDLRFAKAFIKRELA